MDIQKKTMNGVTILELQGNSSAAPIIQALDSELRGAISLDTLKVFLDVKNLEFLDSATLEAFISYQKKFTQVSATLAFVNVNEYVDKVFEICRISSKLTTYGDMDSAMKTVRQRRR